MSNEQQLTRVSKYMEGDLSALEIHLRFVAMFSEFNQIVMTGS